MAWWTALLNGMNAVNPLLLWGGLAVSAPIIIHLLSRRKFRILDWAAMDFLLEAERKNRRRVRLENLIILLLRCLAILLLVALASRLFFQPESKTQTAGEGAGFERIFILDDSASMQASGENKQLVFDAAKESLAKFIEELAQSHPSDRVTLLTTSNPESPLFVAEFLRSSASGEGGTSADAASSGERGAAQIAQRIRALEPTDRAADYDKTLLALQEKVIGQSDDSLNRVVYFLSDFRARDWRSKSATADKGPIALLKNRISKNVLAVQLCDVGASADDNLIVSNVYVTDEADQPAAWVAGVRAKVVVSVKNAGKETVSDIDVELDAGDAGTQRAKIKEIKPGEEQPAAFNVVASVPTDGEPKAMNLFVRASIDRPDVLRLDNDRLFAGRVSPGVRVLVVDGDPGESFKDSERYLIFLALRPNEGKRTRWLLESISDTEFERDGANFDQYDLVMLCNVYRIPEEQLPVLDKWVQAGGGLVIALGDRIDESYYNDKLFAEGKGLLPFRLDGRHGDEKRETWADLALDTEPHPFWQYIRILEIVPKVFQWWRAEEPAKAADATPVVTARITDPDVPAGAPAVVEVSRGAGRVVASVFPLHDKWVDWGGGGLAAVTNDISRVIARKPKDDGSLDVGQPIDVLLDAQRFRRDIKIGFYAPAKPDDAKAAAKEPGEQKAQDVKTEQAMPLEKDPSKLEFKYADTAATGYYELELTKLVDGEPVKTLYTANVDPTEGDLARVDQEELQTQLGEAATIVAGGPTLGSGSEGAKREFSFEILIGLLGVLAVEQFLAWWFGKKRG